MSEISIPTPIFTKTYELIKWLVPLTIKFPRSQRFVIAQAIQQTTQKIQLHLLEAQRSQNPQARLLHADVALAQLRFNFRLCHDWKLITAAQFEHGVILMDEVGRLLGAWIKTTKKNVDALRASSG
jgi:hypothetical protein